MSDTQQRNAELLARVRIRRDELYQSILSLEGALSAPSKGREREWARGVSDHLAQVRSALDEHIAVTEGSGALFDDMMDQAPRLAHAIGALRQEHGSLRSMMDEAARRTESVEGPGDVETTRTRLLDVIRVLLEHRHRGAELVYDAYAVDIGAAD